MPVSPRVLATFHRAVLRSPALFLSGLFALLIITPVRAVDLFTCEDSGHVLAFTVPDAKPVPATVDQADATQAAIDWARRFYHRDDLDVLAVEFQVRPTRFWRVTFLVRERGQTIRLYAVVLPDGRVVVPIIRDET